jgi:hypothetical protein
MLKKLLLTDLFNFDRVYNESHLVLEKCKSSFFQILRIIDICDVIEQFGSSQGS